jgi:hypothetical protein
MRNRYVVRRDRSDSMVKTLLTKKEVDVIKEHVKDNPMTMAIIRTEHAPTELDPLLKALARACKLELSKRSWSPASDFGFAELNSDTKILVLLWVGGKKTELMSVSETDPATVLDMEQEVFSTNFLSSSIRDGL